ncbi:hypothetical protein CB0940_01321, partial [Cercospora beticola]
FCARIERGPPNSLPLSTQSIGSLLLPFSRLLPLASTHHRRRSAVTRLALPVLSCPVPFTCRACLLHITRATQRACLCHPVARRQACNSASNLKTTGCPTRPPVSCNLTLGSSLLARCCVHCARRGPRLRASINQTPVSALRSASPVDTALRPSPTHVPASSINHVAADVRLAEPGATTVELERSSANIATQPAAATTAAATAAVVSCSSTAEQWPVSTSTNESAPGHHCSTTRPASDGDAAAHASRPVSRSAATADNVSTAVCAAAANGLPASSACTTSAHGHCVSILSSSEDPMFWLRAIRGWSMHQLRALLPRMCLHASERADSSIRAGAHGLARPEPTSEHSTVRSIRSTTACQQPRRPVRTPARSATAAWPVSATAAGLPATSHVPSARPDCQCRREAS